MKAKELADMLMKHPEAKVQVRDEKEHEYSDYTRGLESRIGDLLEEAVIWTGETIVIAADLLDLDFEG